MLSGLRVYRHDNKTAKGTAAQPAAGYLAIPFAAFRVVSGVTCTLRQSSNTYFGTCSIQLNMQLQSTVGISYRRQEGSTYKFLQYGVQRVLVLVVPDLLLERLARVACYG